MPGLFDYAPGESRERGGYLRRSAPEVYGALGGLLGTAPDQFEGSVLDPLTAKVRSGAQYGFPVGTATQILPLLGGLLSRGASMPAQLGRGQKGAIFPRDKALATAQRNAAKPVSEGGLGLGPNNTAAERSKALGFEDGWYHGTTGDIRKFSQEFLGESTGAASAKKAHFLARDPVNPPASMRVKADANSDSVAMLRELGIPEAEINKLNSVSFAGNGPETASGYASIGGSREYKEAMRRANAAESKRNWSEHEKWMKVAEDSEIGRNNDLQSLVAKYGDSRDVMLDSVNKAIYSKQLPQQQAAALDAKVKQLMPYGWYNSYSIPQMRSLKTEIAKIADAPEGALRSIDDFISLKASRQLAENTEQGGNVMPLMLRGQKSMEYDFGGNSYRDQTYSDLIDQASRGGSDTLFLRNTFDPGRGPAKLVDVAAATNPASIRSRFAAFDPARVNESDLLGRADPELLKYLAGAGLLGVGGYKAYSGAPQ